MHVLILGYSTIVQRRVLPALLGIESITHVDIASRSKAGQINLKETKSGEIFTDYWNALNSSKADLVYISTMNSEHSQWAEAALNKNYHVIVDKPAFLNLEISEKLVSMAKIKNLCLAEATVYEYHPQIEKIKSLFNQQNKKAMRINATFSFPPLQENNFRYKKEFGGGALRDLGPYAVSPGRIFFEAEPVDVYCKLHSWSDDKSVDTSFSILTTYSDGRVMIGDFGFNTQYQNWINILSGNLSVYVSRIFTNTPEAICHLKVESGVDSEDVAVAQADCFSLFIKHVANSIQLQQHHHFSDNLLSDARAMAMLRASAQKNIQGLCYGN